MDFRLPELHRHWPFPRRINPFFIEENSRSCEWFQSHELFDEEMQYKFREIRSGLLAAFAYPDLSRDHFRVACDLMNILFAVDDISDNMSTSEALLLAKAALEGLRGSTGHYECPQQQQIHMVHKGFWENASKTASETVKLRFIKSYKAYLDAIVEEATERQDYRVRENLEDYFALRRSTRAIVTSLDLIMLPLEIPEEYLKQENVNKLETMAIDLISVANDVVSFNVEQARGDIHNIIIVLMESQRLSVQEAMGFVDNWYQQMSSKFLSIMKKMENSLDDGNDINRRLKLYIDGLAQWVTTNYEWSFETSRFFGPLRKGVYKARTVALLPKRGK